MLIAPDGVSGYGTLEGVTLSVIFAYGPLPLVIPENELGFAEVDPTGIVTEGTPKATPLSTTKPVKVYVVVTVAGLFSVTSTNTLIGPAVPLLLYPTLQVADVGGIGACELSIIFTEVDACPLFKVIMKVSVPSVKLSAVTL